MTDETKDLNEVVDSTTVDQVNVNIDELIEKLTLFFNN